MSTPCILSKFHNTVGALHYLVFTHLDIVFTATMLADSSINRRTIILKLSNAFQGFGDDAYWAGDRDDKHSVGAYYNFYGANLISWICKHFPCQSILHDL